MHWVIFIKFVADRDYNGDTKEAYKYICQKYNINLKNERQTTGTYTVGRLRKRKKLCLLSF